MGYMKNNHFTDTSLEREAEEMWSDPGYNDWADEYQKHLNQSMLDNEALAELMSDNQEESKMKLNEVYPSSSGSLKAEDLKGREVKVSIEKYEVREFQSDKGAQNKIVLSFKGREKTLVCNKTNSRKIEAAYGDELNDWIGKEIIMYPDKTDFGGNLVDCIRVRVPMDELPDDEIPF